MSEIPLITAKVDVTQIERAVNLANELIDKIELIKDLTTEFNNLIEAIDLETIFPETPVDS